MKTAHKIAIARAAYYVVHGARRMAGRPDRTVATRNGLRFDLDLSEGIDFSIYLIGAFERDTERALERWIVPGTTAADIGANIGAHTLGLARAVGPAGRVFAFEPTEFAFTKLVRNISLNPELESRIVARQCFLGATEQADVPQGIYSSWPLVGGKDLHAKHLGAEMATVGASVRTLDGVLAEHGSPRLGFVKLDVDGYECDVLAGARGTLQRDRPVFLLELAPYVLRERGASVADFAAFFEPLGYTFLDEKTGRPIAGTLVETASGMADGESINLIARAGDSVPQHRI